MARVKVITGSARSGRRSAVDRRFLSAAGPALLVLPGRSDARARESSLLQDPSLNLRGFWGRRVLDLAGLAEALVGGGQRLDRLERRLLIESAIRAKRETLIRLLAVDPEDMPGLSAHLLANVMQLKQAAVEPEALLDQLAKARVLTPVDEAVACVYARYQAALKSLGRYDVPGLYWAAEARCRESHPSLLREVSLLLLDGFDDFTPSELRFLDALAERVPELVIGLHVDIRASRADAFAASRRALEKLRTRLEIELETLEESAPVDETAFVAEHLFWRDVPPQHIPLGESITLAPCIDVRHEAEFLARAIRALLDRGVPTGDIAIAQREGGAALSTLLAALGDLDIPVRATLRQAATASVPGALLLGFLDMLNAWERDPVLELLSHPALWPDEPAESATCFGFVVRKALLLAGEQEWERQLAHLAEVWERNPKECGKAAARIPDPIQTLGVLRQRLNALRGLARSFPDEAEFKTYLDAARDLISKWRFVDACDAESLRAIASVLRRLGHFAPEGRIRRDAFQRAVTRALEETEVPASSVRSGVLVAEPEYLRNRAFRHLFVTGLNQGNYPRSPALNALYGRRDLARLARAGIELDDAPLNASRERLLFLRLFLETQGPVTLTWRVQDAAGREATQSPFAVELNELLRHRPGARRPAPAASAIIARAEEASSLREVAACAAVAGGKGLAALRLALPETASGLEVESERWREAPCGLHDGVLEEPGLISRIAARYNQEHCFSAAQLEAWLECPFRFLQQRILEIDDTQPFEGELDPMMRGSILHDVLHRFHAARAGEPLNWLMDEGAAGELDRLLDEAMNRVSRQLQSLPPEIVAAERAHLGTMLKRYLGVCRERDDAHWRPARFEVPFGASARQADEEVPPAFTLELEPGEVVLFSGRVDRIDFAESGKTARIIDYKSGGVPTAGAIQEGRNIQLGVYALALEQTLAPGMACESAYYVPVGKAAWRESLGKSPSRDKEKWAQREPNMRAAIARAVAAIRSGHFPPLPAGKDCHGCGYAKACRRTAARQARKTDPFRDAFGLPDEEGEEAGPGS
jgi:ATP-dependent helicase/DNAse subunit B